MISRDEGGFKGDSFLTFVTKRGGIGQVITRV